MNWFPFDEESWEEPKRRGAQDGDDDEAGAHRWAARGEDDEAGTHGWTAPAEEDEDPFTRRSGRWPLDPRDLYPREQWIWFEQLWADACMLRERYRLGLRAGWWEDAIQVEAIAALAAWIDRYDTGEWDDPPGKLNLLYELERVAALLRDGLEPFHPERDRGPFLRYLIEFGAQPPPRTDGPG